MARVMCRLLLPTSAIHLALRERRGKKKKKVSPDKDSMLDTLTLLEMYLGKFVSTGQNLKLAMATGFSTKVHLVKAMVFPVVMCGCES